MNALRPSKPEGPAWKSSNRSIDRELRRGSAWARDFAIYEKSVGEDSASLASELPSEPLLRRRVLHGGRPSSEKILTT